MTTWGDLLYLHISHADDAVALRLTGTLVSKRSCACNVLRWSSENATLDIHTYMQPMQADSRAYTRDGQTRLGIFSL